MQVFKMFPRDIQSAFTLCEITMKLKGHSKMSKYLTFSQQTLGVFVAAEFLLRDAYGFSAIAFKWTAASCITQTSDSSGEKSTVCSPVCPETLTS